MTKIEIAATITTYSIFILIGAVAIDFAMPPIGKVLDKITGDDTVDNTTFKSRLPMAFLAAGGGIVLNKIFTHYYPKK